MKKTEIIQAVLAHANREANDKEARAIVSSLLPLGIVEKVNGKWTFRELYASCTEITEDTVTTKFYHVGQLAGIQPDYIEGDYEDIS
jgi:hypothetical protein